mmetsp:Transcript_785/g.2267  ORF Transcript_785/g.2267 Transcript_785/m.2267 type:complete len:231 (+) Transcript_785:2490-3182(+)
MRSAEPRLESRRTFCKSSNVFASESESNFRISFALGGVSSKMSFSIKSLISSGISFDPSIASNNTRISSLVSISRLESLTSTNAPRVSMSVPSRISRKCSGMSRLVNKVNRTAPTARKSRMTHSALISLPVFSGVISASTYTSSFDSFRSTFRYFFNTSSYSSSSSFMSTSSPSKFKRIARKGLFFVLRTGCGYLNTFVRPYASNFPLSSPNLHVFFAETALGLLDALPT